MASSRSKTEKTLIMFSWSTQHVSFQLWRSNKLFGGCKSTLYLTNFHLTDHHGSNKNKNNFNGRQNSNSKSLITFFWQCSAPAAPSLSRRLPILPRVPTATKCSVVAASPAFSSGFSHGSMWNVQCSGMHVLWIIPWNTVSSREMNPRSISSASHKDKELKFVW